MKRIYVLMNRTRIEGAYEDPVYAINAANGLSNMYENLVTAEPGTRVHSPATIVPVMLLEG